MLTFFQEISSGIHSDGDMTSHSNYYKDKLLQMKEEKERLEGKIKKLFRELEHLQGIDYFDGHYKVEEESVTLKKDVKFSGKTEIHTKNTQTCEKEEEIKALKIKLSRLNDRLAAKIREVCMYSSCA